MLLELAADREVVLVGGKGGTGKTAVASALALACARAGRPTLVVSTDPAHNLGHLWQRPIGDREVDLAARLRGLEIDPRRTTDAHIDAVRHTLQRLMPEHLSGEIRRHLELAREAPGTHEAALLERLAEVIENRGPDELVVVDTAPSGHTARLLALPELMQAWTDGLLRSRHRSERFGAALRGLGGVDTAGRQNPSADRRARRDREIRAVLDRRRERFCRLRTTLQDARRTAFVIVLAAERVPVQESIELHDELLTSGLHVAGLVANKLSPADAGPLLAARHRQERPQLDQLRARLPGLPVVEIPLLAGEVAGASGVGLLTPYL